MVDTGIFATTAEVQHKVGAFGSTVANAEAYINDYMTQAESFINVATRHNWSDNYATLNVDVRGLLKLAASNIAAIYVINYDMSAFPSRTFAEDAINVLWDGANSAISLLKDQKGVVFIKEA